MTPAAIGPLVQAFFLDGLTTRKGLRPTSVRSYRDTLRLFLGFVAQTTRRRITRLTLADLSVEHVLQFLRHLEAHRHNRIRTRKQRLACLHTFFEDLAGRVPEMVAVAERVAAIPTKRVAPPETHFLERDEIRELFATMPTAGRHALRDRTLLLFLYNTGARVQEVADLRGRDLNLGPTPRVRLHGKGDKWRTCPLWAETARQLQTLCQCAAPPTTPDGPVFTSRRGRPLTRFGIYKIVRRHACRLAATNGQPRHLSPHVVRHTTAVHLLEAGVEVNVIRGWLVMRVWTPPTAIAEINARAKEAALQACEPPAEASEGFPRAPVWRTDAALLAWLNVL